LGYGIRVAYPARLDNPPLCFIYLALKLSTKQIFSLV